MYLISWVDVRPGDDDMWYEYVDAGGRLTVALGKTPSQSKKVACLYALKATYGEAIPEGSQAAILRNYEDGRRYWVVVTATRGVKRA